MLRALMETLGNIQEQTSNASREVQILRENRGEMPETQTPEQK